MIRPQTRIALIVALGLLSAACVSEREAAERAIVNPLERYPLSAHEAGDETLLAVHGSGVSAGQHAALVGVANRWRDTGGRVITLRAPKSAGGASFAMAEQVRSILVAEGVAPAAVRIDGYDPAGEAAAPLVVAFSRYVADVPKCGQAWDNLTGTQSNDNYSNFGCSITANMAAQIANPADLVAPAPETPADASRRSVVIDNYRRGQITGTQLDTYQSGAVSQVIK